MENNTYLFGASGHCKVVIDILQSNGQDVKAIIDDNPKTEYLLGIPVIHSLKFVAEENARFVVSIGDNSIRKKIVNQLKYEFCSAIHTKAIISNFAEIGKGTMVMAGVIVNAAAIIGEHCILNTGVVIEHDCDIADFVHISPNTTLCGNVVVKEGAHIGAGVCVIQGITIGKWAVVGAGAVIIRDVPDYAVVVGNPGKIIKSKERI